MMRTKLKNEHIPTREETQRRAYELWEMAGRPPGRDLEYWLQAERELRDGGQGKAEIRSYRRSAKPRVFGIESTHRPVL